jgi:hypothetical protein
MADLDSYLSDMGDQYHRKRLRAIPKGIPLPVFEAPGFAVAPSFVV